MYNSKYSKHILNSNCAAIDTKEYFKVDDLFIHNSFYRKISPNWRCLIRGNPGSGKSTLCKKIIEEFIDYKKSNKFFVTEISRILWISVSNFKLYPLQKNKILTLEDVFYYEYFMGHPDGEESGKGLAKRLYQLSEQEADSTLFLLDAIDEASQLITSNTIGPVIRQLLKKKQLILTGTFNTFLDAYSYDFNLLIENKGFNKERIFQFINANYLAYKDSLIPFIELKYAFCSLVENPFYLNLICSIWKNNKFHNQQDITMTSIFQRIVSINTEELPEKNFLQTSLGEIAYYSFISDSVINTKTIEMVIFKVNNKSNAQKIDIKEIINRFKKTKFIIGANDNDQLKFSHSLIRDYFVACYLSNNENEMVNFVRDRKFHIDIKNILFFLSGILKNSKKLLNDYFHALTHGANIITNQIYEIVLIIRSLNESGIEYIENQDVFNKINQYIDRYISDKLKDVEKRVLSNTLKSCANLLNEGKIAETFLYYIEKEETKEAALQFLNTIGYIAPKIGSKLVDLSLHGDYRVLDILVRNQYQIDDIVYKNKIISELSNANVIIKEIAIQLIKLLSSLKMHEKEEKIKKIIKQVNPVKIQVIALFELLAINKDFNNIIDKFKHIFKDYNCDSQICNFIIYQLLNINYIDDDIYNYIEFNNSIQNEKLFYYVKSTNKVYKRISRYCQPFQENMANKIFKASEKYGILSIENIKKILLDSCVFSIQQTPFVVYELCNVLALIFRSNEKNIDNFIYAVIQSLAESDKCVTSNLDKIIGDYGLINNTILSYLVHYLDNSFNNEAVFFIAYILAKCNIAADKVYEKLCIGLANGNRISEYYIFHNALLSNLKFNRTKLEYVEKLLSGMYATGNNTALFYLAVLCRSTGYSTDEITQKLLKFFLEQILFDSKFSDLLSALDYFLSLQDKINIISQLFKFIPSSGNSYKRQVTIFITNNYNQFSDEIKYNIRLHLQKNFMYFFDVFDNLIDVVSTIELYIDKLYDEAKNRFLKAEYFVDIEKLFNYFKKMNKLEDPVADKFLSILLKFTRTNRAFKSLCKNKLILPDLKEIKYILPLVKSFYSMGTTAHRDHLVYELEKGIDDKSIVNFILLVEIKYCYQANININLFDKLNKIKLHTNNPDIYTKCIIMLAKLLPPDKIDSLCREALEKALSIRDNFLILRLLINQFGLKNEKIILELIKLLNTDKDAKTIKLAKKIESVYYLPYLTIDNFHYLMNNGILEGLNGEDIISAWGNDQSNNIFKELISAFTFKKGYILYQTDELNYSLYDNGNIYSISLNQPMTKKLR